LLILGRRRRRRRHVIVRMLARTVLAVLAPRHLGRVEAVVELAHDGRRGRDGPRCGLDNGESGGVELAIDGRRGGRKEGGREVTTAPRGGGALDGWARVEGL